MPANRSDVTRTLPVLGDAMTWPLWETLSEDAWDYMNDLGQTNDLTCSGLRIIVVIQSTGIDRPPSAGDWGGFPDRQLNHYRPEYGVFP